MPSVRDYYPGDFWGDLKKSLAWLGSRQNPSVGGWQGSALPTPTTPQFAECGIVSTSDFSTFGQTPIENIVIDAPVSVLPDTSSGPDGFPINFSPQGLPTGNVLVNIFQNTVSQMVTGRCFSLLQPPANYRVDVFATTDQFYYQGSSSLVSLGGGAATWGPVAGAPGAVIAVLYPSSAPQPPTGAAYRALPAGWVAHSNLGVGQKLTGYFARLYVKTDIEYLQEDNVPILVQDAHHARCGSSVIPASGALTVHVLDSDPVAGPTLVYTSLQTLAAFQGLPRSFTVPTSDPLYVPDVTSTNAAALQNRSFIYDDALAIIAYSAAGNFAAASKIVKQLNTFLDNPGYLASRILENAEDGSTSRWRTSSAGDTVSNLNDPAELPYGTGSVLKFHAANAGDNFIYIGSGLPDSADTMIQFQHKEATGIAFSFDIGVSTVASKVTKVSVTSATAGPAVYDPSTNAVVVPVGPGANNYRTHLVNLANLVATLAGDTLSSISSFTVTLNAAGDLCFDNLSLGGLQPANSLSFSYDIYYGQVDQAYIRTGAMAWVCYAYAIYMAMSSDYTPALYLQRMLTFLATLQSADQDLRNGLLYAGFGKYQDPGYQFVPGLQNYVSTEHNVDAYFALKRAAKVLPTAATQLLKSGTISGSQATALNSSAILVSSMADVIAAKLTTNLYIPPGTDPGHFAQGAYATGIDTSQALDAAGSWSAMLCHAIADDVKATECLKFVYQKFYLQNQQILLSTAASSFNQAYQQLQTFNGFKAYNDSPGGYNGSPLSVWQEGTSGVILALLRTYNVPNLSAFFASVEGSLDAFLAKLITGLRTVRSTTGDGSLLSFSLASRGLPYEFETWPAFSSTAWFCVTAINSALLLATDTDPQVLPHLLVPAGLSQSINELDGESSIGSFEVEAIDPGGMLKGLAAQQNLVGKVARLKMGFPGQSLGDFTTLHTLQVVSAGFNAEGRMTLECADVQRFLLGSALWTNGGPSAWTPGMSTPLQPVGKAFQSNAFPVSDKNPRWISGNPLDILLVALQNELGVGQDPSLPQAAWTLYRPGNDATLINPNSFLDVPGIVALRNGAFSGDWFEFKITRPVEAKQWLEDQILKVLGLYTMVRADGRLALKSMKPPATVQPSVALNEKNLVGIPEYSRLPVINVVTVRMGVDDSQRETAARQYSDEVTFQQGTSLALYKQEFRHQVEANGLRMPRGGYLRAFLLADRVFRRHAFAPPKYQVKAFLSAVVLELGDLVWLNHPLVPDLNSGSVGLTNVICEVVDRQPNYSEGWTQLDLLDTRFINFSTPYQIAAATAGIPNWAAASSTQRRQYMFISSASTNGTYSDGSPGNTVF